MTDPSSLLFALIFAGALIYGLYTGHMPMRFISIDRAERPALFWAVGVAFALASLFFLAGALGLRQP